jgi:hypothetical protein
MLCSTTRSPAAQSWPEGIISIKLTMNPYLYAMAQDEAAKQGLSLWEMVNIALWEKLGKPDYDTLMEFAARLDLNDEDPKWKQRLKMAARHEMEVQAERKRQMQPPRGEDSTRP